MRIYSAGDYILELNHHADDKNRLIVKIRDATGDTVNPDQVVTLSRSSTDDDVRTILPADCEPTKQELLDIVTGLRLPCQTYWICKLNPRTCRIEDRLLDPEPSITWYATRYQDEMRLGDITFLWRTGPDPGICAVVRIDAAPQDMSELPHEQQYWRHPDTQIRCRARGTITHRLKCLPRTDLRLIPELKDLTVMHGFQMITNLRVTPYQGEKLMELLDARTT